MSDNWDDEHALARELVAQVEADPVHTTKNCSNALLQVQQERDEALTHLLAVPYAVALYLHSNWDAWLQYINTSALWAHRSRKKPNPKPRRNADHGRVLSIVFEATFAGPAGKGYQRGWWYARCLENAFIRSIPPSDLPAHIDACGGLKKMYRRAIESNPRRRPKGLDADDAYFDLRDPAPELGRKSKGDLQADTPDPVPKLHNQDDCGKEASPQPDSEPDEADRTPQIQLSAKLRRKCKATPDGETLVVVVRHRPDGIWMSLPRRGGRKKSRTSGTGWLRMKVQPDPLGLPDCAYGGWRSEQDGSDYTEISAGAAAIGCSHIMGVVRTA